MHRKDCLSTPYTILFGTADNVSSVGEDVRIHVMFNIDMDENVSSVKTMPVARKRLMTTNDRILVEQF